MSCTSFLTQDEDVTFDVYHLLGNDFGLVPGDALTVALCPCGQGREPGIEGVVGDEQEFVGLLGFQATSVRPGPSRMLAEELVDLLPPFPVGDLVLVLVASDVVEDGTGDRARLHSVDALD